MTNFLHLSSEIYSLHFKTCRLAEAYKMLEFEGQSIKRSVGQSRSSNLTSNFNCMSVQLYNDPL